MTSLRKELPQRASFYTETKTLFYDVPYSKSLNVKDILTKRASQFELHPIYLHGKRKNAVEVEICWDNLPLLLYLKAQMNVL